MIDKKTVNDKNKLAFIKEIYTKLYGDDEELIDEEFMRILNKKLFPVWEFESKEYFPFTPNSEYGFRCYLAKDEPNEDVYLLADLVIEVIDVHVESDSFKHLSITYVSEDKNEYLMTLYLQNENYYCEEYKIKLKMTRRKDRVFDVIILKCKRVN